MERAVKGAGDQFSLRGVEVVATGTVVDHGDGPSLELGRTGEILRLRPLVQKVQWSFGEQRSHSVSDAERLAYTRLKADVAKGSRRLRVVGPLVGRMLEVRSFSPP
jgi:hypothetical protein